MSLGIKFSTFLRVEHPFARRFEDQIFLTCLQLVGTWVKNIFRNLVPYFFDMSSASGYMGEKYFQEFGPRFLTCPQLVGTWVQNIFRNLVNKYIPVLCQEYMLFFCLPLRSQPRLNTQQQGRAPPVWRLPPRARPCCCVLSLG